MAIRTPTNRYKRVEDLYFVEAGDEVYLTVASKDVIVCINYPAFLVLKNLDGFSEIDYLAAWLSSIIKQDPIQVTNSIDTLCRQLLNFGVLELIQTSRNPRQSGFKIDMNRISEVNDFPRILKEWQGSKLYNGLFVSTKGSDPCVVVTTPENGDGGENGGEPPEVICEQTVNIPNGIFLNDHKLIVRTFNQKWKTAFKDFKITCQGQSKRK